MSPSAPVLAACFNEPYVPHVSTMLRSVAASGTTSPCCSLVADDSVDDAMELMGREQVRRIPIVDERGSLVGVVSQADIARKAGNDAKVERTVEEISQPGGAHQS